MCFWILIWQIFIYFYLHSDWNLDGNSNCDIYFNGGCGRDDRYLAFGGEDNINWKTEGICSQNSCYSDAHCEPVFDPAKHYQGTGFWPNTNGVATEYLEYGDDIWYPLIGASHYDQREKVAAVDRDGNGKYFGLTLHYHESNHTEYPLECYAIYNDKITIMDILIQYPTSHWSAFYDHLFSPPTQCEPYSFICHTSFGRHLRLPQEIDYYFGTEWIPYDWSEYDTYGDGYNCGENWYYFDGIDWIVNGGPTLTTNDIWYYNEGNTCEGCNKIDVLECLELCIYNEIFDGSTESCGCGTSVVAPTNEPTTEPTVEPTPSPINA